MISFIIVSWNTKALTLLCLESIERSVRGEKETILVDNASDDDTVAAVRKKFPQVEIIANSSNRGYAVANNQALRRARGELIVLLNSDCQILTAEPETVIEKYLQRHPECGVVGGLLYLQDGSLQTGVRLFNTTGRVFMNQILFAGTLRPKTLSLDQPFETDYVDGAFLCARRECFEKAGFLDEDFFMYAEDMEWCLRVRKQGWTIRVLPRIRVRHVHAASSIKNYPLMLVHNSINNSIFIGRTQNKSAAFLAFLFYLCGMLLRIPLSLIRGNDLARDYAAGFLKTCSQWKNVNEKI